MNHNWWHGMGVANIAGAVGSICSSNDEPDRQTAYEGTPEDGRKYGAGGAGGAPD